MTTLAPATRNAGQTFTGRAVGSCGECGAGIAVDGVTADTVGKCPGCGARVRARLVYGEHSDIPCDGRCMGAVGPSCSCGCAGANHGRYFLNIELVPVFDRDRARAAQDKRRSAHATRRAEREAREARERAARVAAMLTDAPELGDIVGDAYAGTLSRFVADMREALHAGRELSPRQIASCVAIVRRDRERAARAAERRRSDADARARGVRVPTGRLTITGEIVSAKTATDERHSYHGRTDIKITVQSADGWRVYGTLPRSVYPPSYSADTFAAWRDALPGQTVTLTAQVKPSDRDPVFGFYSRPTGAYLGNAPAPAAQVEPVAPADASPFGRVDSAGRYVGRLTVDAFLGMHAPAAPAPVAQVEPAAPAPFVSGWAGLANV